jgi:hypothetical protein
MQDRNLTVSGVINAPFFMAGTTGQKLGEATPPQESVLKGTPLEGTVVEQLYKNVPSKNNGFELESDKGHYTFLSPKDITDRNVFDGKMFDIFIKYWGMGHVFVYYFVPATGMFCMREDGGSNGWEREDHYNKYSSDEYQPSSFPKYGDMEKNDQIKMNVQYTLKEMMSLIYPDWE